MKAYVTTKGSWFILITLIPLALSLGLALA